MLSALYDGAIDLSTISRERPESVLKERLLLEEAARRQLLRYIEFRSTVAGNMPFSDKDRGNLLLEDLERGQVLLMPWLEPQTEVQTTEDLETYYYEIVKRYKEHEIERKAREHGDG